MYAEKLKTSWPKASMMLSMLILISNSAMAATFDKSAWLPGIPQAGDPSFRFEPATQGNDYAATIQSWYSNYLYIAPAEDDGYDVYAYNSGVFEYEQTAGVLYEGQSGSMSLNAHVDGDGNVTSGQYAVSGMIDDMGMTESHMLTTGDIVSMESDEYMIGFATDNISCASMIVNCLERESVYLFTDMAMPTMEEMNGTRGFVSSAASITTVPIPGSALLLFSALVVPFRKHLLKQTD